MQTLPLDSACQIRYLEGTVFLVTLLYRQSIGRESTGTTTRSSPRASRYQRKIRNYRRKSILAPFHWEPNDWTLLYETRQRHIHVQRSKLCLNYDKEWKSIYLRVPFASAHLTLSESPELRKATTSTTVGTVIAGLTCYRTFYPKDKASKINEEDLY